MENKKARPGCGQAFWKELILSMPLRHKVYCARLLDCVGDAAVHFRGYAGDATREDFAGF